MHFDRQILYLVFSFAAQGVSGRVIDRGLPADLPLSSSSADTSHHIHDTSMAQASSVEPTASSSTLLITTAEPWIQPSHHLELRQLSVSSGAISTGVPSQASYLAVQSSSIPAGAWVPSQSSLLAPWSWVPSQSSFIPSPSSFVPVQSSFVPSQSAFAPSQSSDVPSQSSIVQSASLSESSASSSAQISTSNLPSSSAVSRSSASFSISSDSISTPSTTSNVALPTPNSSKPTEGVGPTPISTSASSTHTTPTSHTTSSHATGTAHDNNGDKGSAHSITHGAVAGIATGLTAGAVMLALGAVYLYRRKKEGKTLPFFGPRGSKHSQNSVYPKVAWLYDPEMPGHSRNTSGSGQYLIPEPRPETVELDAGFGSPDMRPTHDSSPLLPPAMALSRSESPGRSPNGSPDGSPRRSGGRRSRPMMSIHEEEEELR